MAAADSQTTAGTETQPRSAVFSNLLKGTALYTVTLFAQRIAGVILLPINTRFLTTTDYGVNELLEKVAILTSVLLGLYISGSLGYFYFEKDSNEDRARVASTTVLAAALVGLVAGGAGMCFIGPIRHFVFHDIAVKPYLILVFGFFPISFAVEALFSWLRVIDRPAIFTAASVMRLGVTILATIIFVAGFKLRVLGVLLSSAAAAGSVAIFLSIYFFRQVPFQFDIPLMWRMVRFSLPLSLGGIAMFIIHFGDTFVLPIYRPFSEVGIYAMAYKMGMLISGISGAFNTYWTAQVFQVAKRDDSNQVISRIFTYVTLALAFCSVSLVVLCRPALQILSTPAYQYAAFLVPAIVLAYFIRSIAEFFRCFFVVAGHPEYDAVCNWISAAVCVAAYLTLIPRYGMWGAAWATVLGFLSLAVTSIIWTYRLKPYHFDNVRLAKIALVSIVLVGVYLLVPVHALLPQIGWAILLILGFPGLLFAVGFPQPEEVARAQGILRQAAHRVGF